MMLVDCNFLAHRAFYSMGRRGQNGTGVIFGFVQAVKILLDRFTPSNVCLCFDHHLSIRTATYPEYKANRKYTKEELESKKQLNRDIDTLKFCLLRRMGFKNIIYRSTLEADDLIAKITDAFSPETEITIVSADHDLYQLLYPNVIMYNPRSSETVNRKSFKQKYNISVSQWPMVKAIAGCATDNIKGIKGVGEKTAIKYLNGEEIYPHLLERINENQELINANLKLVKLPHPKCPPLRVLKQPELETHKWTDILEDYYKFLQTVEE